MFRRFLSRAKRARRAARPRPSSGYRRRLILESLEERHLLAITVDTLTDEADGSIVDGDISLRDAIAAATAGETINFNASLAGGTIALDQALGHLAIDVSLTIDASALDGGLTIDAGNGTDTNFNTGDGIRIFNIDDGAGGTDSPVTLVGLTLTGGDVAAGDLLGDGGAIRAVESLTVRNSIITGNAAVGGGGGIFASTSTGQIKITNSTISENAAGGDGGGLHLFTDSSLIEISGSSISGNSGYAGGGALLTVNSGTITITSSTVSGNGALDDGGGLSIYTDTGGTSTIAHSTITLNTSNTMGMAGSGGGVYAFGPGTINLGHTVIAGNTDLSVTPAPDIDLTSSPPGTVNVDFSLIGDNTGSGLTEAQTPDADGNLIGDPGGGGVIDAMLGELAPNGGPTQTHALLAGSPAIDIGDPSIAAPPANDQRGAPFLRIVDGGGGVIIDMGAYERQTVAPLNLIVDTLVDENDGDYSPGDLSLREAIGLANGSIGADTITFAAGLFAGEAQSIELSMDELVVTEALTINGPGAALLTIVGNSRIINITAATGDFTLDGMTFTGGSTTGNNVDFSDTTYCGGAIRSLSTGNLTITNSTVTGNHTEGSYADGGAVFAVGNLVLTNSTVSENYTSGYDANGGGLAATGTVTLTNSIVSGNHAEQNFADGGGFYANGEVTATSSTISGNHTAGNSAQGGGFYTNSDITITSSTISGNHTEGSSSDGGGFYGFNNATVSNSTISGNRTEGANSDGGGIFVYDNLDFRYSTVTDNHANGTGADGGGVFVDEADLVVIRNSIIAGNTADDDAPDLSPDTVTLTVDYSLIGDTTDSGVNAGTGTGNILDTDPMLGPLENNGGPTLTHRLLPGSPAIDAGDPAAVAGVGGVPEFDQRGTPFARVRDGNGNGTVFIDMGAYELELDESGPQVVGLFVSDMVLSVSPADNLLRMIDPYTGATLSSVAMTLTGQTILRGQGLATDPTTGLIYAIVDLDGQFGRELITVNPRTGVATAIGDTGDLFAGLAFDATGNLFGVTGDGATTSETLFSIDKTTAAVTSVTALGNGDNGEALAFNPDTGLLYHASGQATVIFESLTTAGAGLTNISIVGTDLEDGQVRALAYVDSEDTFLWSLGGGGGMAAGGSQLFRVNQFGQPVLVGTLDHTSKGLAVLTKSDYDLFAPKPGIDGPTPGLDSLTILISDPPPRVPGLTTTALNEAIAENPGHYLLVGDSTGIIPIADVEVINDPIIIGQNATASIRLRFAIPLPDDRFTLTISDAIRDPDGNMLDGETNPVSPTFPSGDGVPGGDFVVRFTIDTRPEIGIWSGGTALIDTNGNFLFDPANPDASNRDLAYFLGFASDYVFAGNFVENAGDPADGFDKLAVYGRVGSTWRWLIDFNNDGVPDKSFTEPAAVNGVPVAGNFDGNAANGDEVGIFTGTTWHFDTDHDFKVDTTLAASGYGGFPIVGDFNGDGNDDLAAYSPAAGSNVFSVVVATAPHTWATTPTHTFGFGLFLAPGGYFGLGGVRERPVAADMNGDGIDDFGLWAPDGSQITPGGQAHWYFLISGNDPFTPAAEVSVLDRIVDGFVPFRSMPFGNDLFGTFGSGYGIPLVGNFDPPVAGGAALPFAASVTTTNLQANAPATTATAPTSSNKGANHTATETAVTAVVTAPTTTPPAKTAESKAISTSVTPTSSPSSSAVISVAAAQPSPTIAAIKPAEVPAQSASIAGQTTGRKGRNNVGSTPVTTTATVATAITVPSPAPTLITLPAATILPPPVEKKQSPPELILTTVEIQKAAPIALVEVKPMLAPVKTVQLAPVEVKPVTAPVVVTQQTPAHTAANSSRKGRAHVNEIVAAPLSVGQVHSVPVTELKLPAVVRLVDLQIFLPSVQVLPSTPPAVSAGSVTTVDVNLSAAVISSGTLEFKLDYSAVVAVEDLPFDESIVTEAAAPAESAPTASTSAELVSEAIYSTKDLPQSAQQRSAARTAASPVDLITPQFAGRLQKLAVDEALASMDNDSHFADDFADDDRGLAADEALALAWQSWDEL